MSNVHPFNKQLTIGVLDSGVGGLSVLRPLVKATLGLKQVPHFIYLADTQRFPYGQKTSDQIQKFAAQMIAWLAAKRCDIAIIACHTISATVSSDAYNQKDMRIFDLSGIGSWLAIPNDKNVVVLSTPATAATGVISKSIAASHPDKKVLDISCPELASIIENDLQNSDQLQKVLYKYAQQVISTRFDTVVLGCTHYPFIADKLSKLLPSSINVIDPALQFVDYILKDLGLNVQEINTSQGIEIGFHVSGSIPEFTSKLSVFTPELRGTVTPVTLEALKKISNAEIKPSRLVLV
jgi:glutamate racemase